MSDELQKLAKKLSKKYGTLRIAGEVEDTKEFVSVGNLAMDLMLEGGIALGYATEWSGKSGSGKTLMIQLALADMQKRYDAIGVWIDRENAWYNKRAADLGVNLNNVILLSPADVPTVPDAEIALRDILSGLPKDSYKFIAIDSISAFMKEGDKADMGKRAQSWHNLFRAILPYIDNKTSFHFSNQRTFKIGVLFGDNTTTTGGEAPKFYTSYRLKLDDKKAIIDPKRGNEIIGNWISAYIEKTRRGPNHRKIEFPFYYASGIPYYGGYGRLLWKRGYVEPANKTEFKAFKQSTLQYNDEKFSEFEIEKFIEKHPELLFNAYPEYNLNAEAAEEVDEFEIDTE